MRLSSSRQRPSAAERDPLPSENRVARFSLLADADKTVTPIDPLREPLTQALRAHWRAWNRCRTNPASVAVTRERIRELQWLSQRFAACLPAQGTRAWLRDLQSGVSLANSWRAHVNARGPIESLHTQHPKADGLAAIVERLDDRIESLETQWSRYVNLRRIESFEKRLENMSAPRASWGRAASASILDGAGEHLFPLLRDAREATKGALKRPSPPNWRRASESLEELTWALRLFDRVFEARLGSLFEASEALRKITNRAVYSLWSTEKAYACIDRLATPRADSAYRRSMELVESQNFDVLERASSAFQESWENNRRILRPKSLDHALRG